MPGWRQRDGGDGWVDGARIESCESRPRSGRMPLQPRRIPVMDIKVPSASLRNEQMETD